MFSWKIGRKKCLTPFPLWFQDRKSGPTQDTRLLQQGQQKEATESSHMPDTDYSVRCCELPNLHQSCKLFKVIFFYEQSLFIKIKVLNLNGRTELNLFFADWKTCTGKGRHVKWAFLFPDCNLGEKRKKMKEKKKENRWLKKNTKRKKKHLTSVKTS